MNSGMILGFIGAGNMAEALVRGVLAAGGAGPEQVMASDVSEERLRHVAGRYKIRAEADNNAVAGAAHALVLAVKPKDIAGALAGIRDARRSDGLVISIAAGVSTGLIEKALGPGARVVRVMPNTPALVGSGVSGYCAGARARGADMELVRGLFGAVGGVFEMEEKMMDAVTALSGSGPAYVFYLAEAMTDAGIEMGFSEADARAMAAGTLAGAAKMLCETGIDERELRARVTSKGGTTEAAVAVLERAGVKANIIRAIKAAAARSAEMSKTAFKT